MTTLILDSASQRATEVRVTSDTLMVELADGRSIAVPLAWYPRLLHGNDGERGNFRFIGGGEGIHWPDLDEDISVEGIVAGRPSEESQSSLQRWLESRAKVMTSVGWDSIDNTNSTFPIYYCAFLDILGYKSKSALFFVNKCNIPGRIERALDRALAVNSVVLSPLDTAKLSVELFSDSIIMLQPEQNAITGFLLSAATFVTHLSFEGLFIRGGISMGRHSDFLTPKKIRVLTSEALQRAYLLESTHAKVPRILIAPEIVSRLSQHEKSVILKDGDDYMIHFLQYVVDKRGSNLDHVHAMMTEIANMRDSAADLSIKEKCQWMLDYYLWTIGLIVGVDTSRFACFASTLKSRFKVLE